MKKKKENNTDKKKRSSWKYTAILIGSAAIIGSTLALANVNLQSADPIEKIPYTEYMELLDAGDIDRVIYSEEKEYMTVMLFNDETREMTQEEREQYKHKNSDCRYVLYPANEDFRKELLEKGVIVTESAAVGGTLLEAAGNFLYIALIVAMFGFMAKSSPMGNKGFARKATADEIDVTFDDVIGHEEIKGDLQLLVKQLKDGAKAKNLSHGVLFEGGAGTGKTMLAKAIAHEAGVNFISVNSSNLIEMYVGLGAKRVREAFDQAKKNSPCVLFFDEIDAVGAKRGSQRSNRENDQTINALLTELDGFNDKGEILVIAATNRADDLDEALLRSGRFDRKIKVEAPRKWETRQELFDHYLKDLKTDSSVDTAVLAKQTVGFSGADIASICREARLIAFREDKEEVTHGFLEEAIDKMVFKGNRSNDEEHEEDLKYVAYHEAGHAVVTYLTGNSISRISIMGMTSGVGGAVFQADSERFFETRQHYYSQIMIAYAGRASEAIRFGDDKVSQGAGNDITQATKLLLNCVTKLGFDEKVGLIDVDVLSNGSILNEGIAERISQRSVEFYDKTYNLLKENYDLVEHLADKLLEVKTLSGNEAESLLKSYRKVSLSDYPQAPVD
jgi:cell division protease FtsH